MPFVHWLPKNNLRKKLIHLFVLTGRMPKWTHLKSKTNAERTEDVFRYTVEKTHYRPYRTIEKWFRESGFTVKLETIVDSSDRRKIYDRLLNYPIFTPIVRHVLLSFERIALILS